MKKQRILLAEDHVILRQGLAALLSATHECEVIGEAGDGLEAVHQAKLLKPDIILMDISMPHMNGTEVIQTIKRHNPEIKIIVLTAHKTEEYIRATLTAGADAYVLKDDTHLDLMSAITNVQKGKVYLSVGICDKVINGFLGYATTGLTSSTWDMLTSREREVLKLVAEGSKNREIADYLSVSQKTVEKHRTNLMKKLDLHNVSALTTYAIENGLVSQ